MRAFAFWRPRSPRFSDTSAAGSRSRGGRSHGEKRAKRANCHPLGRIGMFLPVHAKHA